MKINLYSYEKPLKLLEVLSIPGSKDMLIVDKGSGNPLCKMVLDQDGFFYVDILTDSNGNIGLINVEYFKEIFEIGKMLNEYVENKLSEYYDDLECHSRNFGGI